MRHLIKVAGVLLALVSSYFVKEFTSLVAPPAVAWLSAGSLVGTYIGLAYADIPHSQRGKVQHVALAAMAIEALYGTLYVFSRQTPGAFAYPMEWYASLPLAVLHGAPFTVLLFLVSLFVTHRSDDAIATNRYDALADELQQLARTVNSALAQRNQAQPTIEVVSAAQLPDAINVTAETKRGKLAGVDVAAEVQRLGSVQAVADAYGVSRQAVDKKLKGGN